MKAIVRDKYGSPEVLEVREHDVPEIRDHEILVHVHATTVNRTDCAILAGKPYVMRFFTGLLKPSSRVPGTDFAGEVVKIGKKVTDFKVGDRVWGFNDQGVASHAEWMKISSDKEVVKIPKNVSYDECIAHAEGGHYALNFINKVKLKEGDRALVNGATGAIGSALLQMLKDQGVLVTAVGNTKNLDLLKELGADKVHNYETEDFTVVADKGFDFIFDAVGKSSFGKCKPLLKPEGVYMSSELGPRGENMYLPLITKWRGGKRVLFPFPKDCKRSLNYINDLMQQNKLKPVIDRTFTPEEIVDAYNYVHSGQKTGSVIIRFR